jgi:hypothetical protein
MRKIILFLALTATLGLMSGSDCAARNKKVIPSKKITTEKLSNPGQFTTIDVSGIADVRYVQSSKEPSVSITCPENIHEYLDVSVSGATLQIGLRKSLDYKGELQVIVNASSAILNTIKASGASRVSIDDGLRTSKFVYDVSGAAKVDIRGTLNVTGKCYGEVFGAGSFKADRLECANFSLDGRGAGSMSVSVMKCDKVNADCSGAARFIISDIACTELVCVGIGSPIVKLSNLACVTLSADMSGAGSFTVTGEATHAKYSTTGSARVGASGMQAAYVKAYASGASSIKCYASEELYAESSIASYITYYGDPKSLKAYEPGRRIKPAN